MRGNRVKAEGRPNADRADPGIQRSSGKEHTSPSRRTRRGRTLLLGIVVLFIVSLMATVPVASAEDEDLAEKIERRTGLSEESTLDDVERRTDPPGSDHVDSIEHKLSSVGSDGGDDNETEGDAEPRDENDTASEEDRDEDGSEQGSGGNESGKGSGSKNVTDWDLDPLGVDCPPSSTDSCEPSPKKEQAGPDAGDAGSDGYDQGIPASKNKARSTTAGEPDDNKDDALTKTATGSGIAMVLAWTLFVASTGPLGRSGKDGEKRQRPQLHLTPESQQREQERESRPNTQSRQAPSHRR